MKWLLLILTVFTLPACIEADLIEDMVAVDQAYIPTVYYLRKNQLPNAKLAMVALQKEWRNLATNTRKAYYEEDLANTLIRVDGYLVEAATALKAEEAIDALNQLENARFEWNDLRSRYGITYYIDEAYEFQMAWDLVQETVSDPVLCWLQWQEFEQQVEDAQKAYKRLRNHPVEWELFAFNDATIALHQRQKIAFHQAWMNFAVEVDCANRENIAVAAQQVTNTFDQLLNLFGDFEPSTIYVAQREL